MTTINLATLTNSTPNNAQAGRGFGDLGQADFFRLLTTQIQQQDPFEPVDNKEMLAQMAQFTSLSGINSVNETLQVIAGKLDALLAAQETASTTSTNTDTQPQE
ncbi:MAG: flagellar hook capping FlgD N-terminal domain-containing protein [Sphingomonadaceae bacterium]|nr:flagellar biosynthesis protein FlgD [Sphingomonadaceae bacterium]